MRPCHRVPSSGRLVVRSVLAGLALLAGFWLGALPASAHSELVSSDPADGAVLAEAPSRVVLTFSEDVREQGSAVVVTGAADARVDVPDSLAISGPRVTVDVDAAAASGDYLVAYRVVSVDGHVVSGTLEYTVQLRTKKSPTPSTSPSPGGGATVSPSTAPAAVGGSAGGASSWPAVALAAAALAAVSVVIVRWRRRRA